MNPEFGAKALEEIEKEFGSNKAIFIKTDVTKIEEFEGTYYITSSNKDFTLYGIVHGRIVDNKNQIYFCAIS